MRVIVECFDSKHFHLIAPEEPYTQLLAFLPKIDLLNLQIFPTHEKMEEYLDQVWAGALLETTVEIRTLL